MASASAKAATTKLILNPVTTLKGHGGGIRSISYFPDGQRIISGSLDKTTRQWDLKAGEEIEEARDVCEKQVWAVAVSQDGRWVVTGGDSGELKACEVETGIVKIFEGHSRDINAVDISAENTLLASGSDDETVRIWSLETGKLVAGPFNSISQVGVVRFSPDLKKLAAKLDWGTCLEIWDIRSQKLHATIGEPDRNGIILSPVFWTNNNKTIIAAFEFSSESELDDHAKTIYEFDASTLEIIGVPFEGHTKFVDGLALSLDGALLASTSSHDDTIKLWAFESRQLLASFDIQNPLTLMLSSDSHQLVYTTDAKDDCTIYICDIPANILAQAHLIARKKSARKDLLNSDATRRPPAGQRKPPIYAIPIAPRPLPTREPRQAMFLRLRKLLRCSSRANTVHSDRNNQSQDSLDFPATLPLPRNRHPAESSPSTSLPGGRAFFNPIQSSSHKGKQRARESRRKTAHIANVPLGQATYGDVVGVDDGVRPFVLFFCLSWFHKKEKKPEPRPVYDDDPESDEEEENVLDPVAVPPKAQHEEIELKPLADQSRPEAEPSRVAASNQLEA